MQKERLTLKSCQCRINISIDISRYVQNGIVAISAVANVSFDDERGKLKIVRMEKEIP